MKFCLNSPSHSCPTCMSNVSLEKAYKTSPIYMVQGHKSCTCRLPLLNRYLIILASYLNLGHFHCNFMWYGALWYQRRCCFKIVRAVQGKLYCWKSIFMFTCVLFLHLKKSSGSNCNKKVTRISKNKLEIKADKLTSVSIHCTWKVFLFKPVSVEEKRIDGEIQKKYYILTSLNFQCLYSVDSNFVCNSDSPNKIKWERSQYFWWLLHLISLEG